MIIKGGKIFDLKDGFVEKDLQYQGRLITKIDQNISSEDEIIDAKGLFVIPGLTDIHFHGCVGYDFCDGTEEAIEHMAEYELANGITTICPASMTFSEEQLSNIFSCAAAYRRKQIEGKGAALVGINMEGPFISYEKKGAQNPTFIHEPDAQMFLRLQDKAEGLIKLLDIAPEVEGAMECIQKVSSQVRISLAHTTANYDTAMEAFQTGAKHVTHLYNAMPPFSHREPGVIGAALDTDFVTVELIVDAIHSHPATVRGTFKMFGNKRIIMISDSMMATGMPDGQYALGGQAVTVVGHTATLTEGGNIAGSATNLCDCVRVAVQKMGIPLETVIPCVTINPAKAIGIDKEYGSLEAGKVADILLLNPDLSIHSIVKAGKKI